MSAERIARLPSELRTIVLARCGAGAEAGHYFATYDDNSNVVRLDYSLLQCPNAPEHVKAPTVCTRSFAAVANICRLIPAGITLRGSIGGGI